MKHIMDTVSELTVQATKVLQADIIAEMHDIHPEKVSALRLKIIGELGAEFGDLRQATEAIENITKAFKRALR